MFTRLIRHRSTSSSFDLVLRLTLIILLLRPMGFWAIQALMLLLATLGLIFPRILRTPLTWLSLSFLIGWRIIDDWPLPDNHIYLLAYWCLALFLSFIAVDAQKTLRTSSRMLIGLAFAFAVLWKGFLSPDYRDGRFFRVAFMMDDRFAYTTMLLGGITAQELTTNREYLSPLPGGAELLDPPKFTEPSSFLKLVRFTTWATLFLEAMVALVFLIPLRRYVPSLRDFFLLSFCVVTYAFAPVAGFGWLLLIMGLAQCKEEQKFRRGLYVAAYILVLLYSEVPWSHLLYQFQKKF